MIRQHQKRLQNMINLFQLEIKLYKEFLIKNKQEMQLNYIVQEDLVATKQALLIGAHLEKDTNNELLSSLEDNINLLNNEIFPQFKGDFQTKKGEIINQISTFKRCIIKFKANLDNVNTGRVARQQQNKQLNDGQKNELILLSQAESTLERGGIR